MTPRGFPNHGAGEFWPRAVRNIGPLAFFYKIAQLGAGACHPVAGLLRGPKLFILRMGSPPFVGPIVRLFFLHRMVFCLPSWALSVVQWFPFAVHA